MIIAEEVVVNTPVVTVTTKMVATVGVITDETEVVNPKESVIFHIKITMTAMIGETNNVMEKDKHSK